MLNNTSSQYIHVVLCHCHYTLSLSYLLLVELDIFLHAGPEALHEVLLHRLQLVQHVIDLLAIELLVQCIESPQLHYILVVSIVAVQNN